MSVFKIGDKVDRASGNYSFPGTVIGVCNKLDGKTLIIVEMDTFGLVHIFNEKTLVHRESGR